MSGFAVAEIEGGKVTLYSRNGKIISHSYVKVAHALERMKVDAVLDGELVALDSQGVSRFSCSRTRSVMRPSCSIASLI